MRKLSGFGLALIFSAAMFAQQRGVVNSQPVVQGSFPNVVFPGGTAAMPGVQRTMPGIVVSGPRLNVPFSQQDPTRLSSQGVRPRPGYSYVGNPQRSRGGAVVAVPVYVGGGYYGGYETPYPTEQAPPQQQPNIIVIYPPAAPASPYEGFTAAPQPAVTQSAQDASAPEAPHYLIAFKDHTIYSAVAYYVEGDTLHYFTTGNTHNQVSLSLVDRDLTERLNRESGSGLQLPK
ncbi:MAG: hypothetical protein C5B51_31800 [Terriglobia bacterium]|nr:MAG: hypothetical protein C5B51_31800 [Terriglobia bacterium]